MSSSSQEEPANSEPNIGLPAIENDAKLTPLAPVLPRWLQNPTVISNDLEDKAAFDEVGELSEDVEEALTSMGCSGFFPVQRLIIPELLESGKPTTFVKRDLCVSAPTGSGKTIAFAVPIVENLKRLQHFDGILAIVILPVKQLAKQVFSVFKTLSMKSGLIIAKAFGEDAFDEEKKGIIEDNGFRKVTKAKVLVATPGRLVDYLRDNDDVMDLSNLRYVVVDEADRILAEMKQNWFKELQDCVRVQQGKGEEMEKLEKNNEFVFFRFPRRNQTFKTDRFRLEKTPRSNFALLRDVIRRRRDPPTHESLHAEVFRSGWKRGKRNHRFFCNASSFIRIHLPNRTRFASASFNLPHPRPRLQIHPLLYPIHIPR